MQLEQHGADGKVMFSQRCILQLLGVNSENLYL